MLEGARSAEPPRKPVWFWGGGEGGAREKKCEFFFFFFFFFFYSFCAGLHKQQRQNKPTTTKQKLTGKRRRERVEHRLRVQARRQALVFGRERRQRLLPAGGELARQQRLELGALGGVLLHVAGEGRLPLGLGGLAASGGLAEDVVGGLGDLRKFREESGERVREGKRERKEKKVSFFLFFFGKKLDVSTPGKKKGKKKHDSFFLRTSNAPYFQPRFSRVAAVSSLPRGAPRGRRNRTGKDGREEERKRECEFRRALFPFVIVARPP